MRVARSSRRLRAARIAIRTTFTKGKMARPMYPTLRTRHPIRAGNESPYRSGNDDDDDDDHCSSLSIPSSVWKKEKHSSQLSFLPFVFVFRFLSSFANTFLLSVHSSMYTILASTPQHNTSSISHSKTPLFQIINNNSRRNVMSNHVFKHKHH